MIRQRSARKNLKLTEIHFEHFIYLFFWLLVISQKSISISFRFGNLFGKLTLNFLTKFKFDPDFPNTEFFVISRRQVFPSKILILIHFVSIKFAELRPELSFVYEMQITIHATFHKFPPIRMQTSDSQFSRIFRFGQILNRLQSWPRSSLLPYQVGFAISQLRQVFRVLFRRATSMYLFLPEFAAAEQSCALQLLRWSWSCEWQYQALRSVDRKSSQFEGRILRETVLESKKEAKHESSWEIQVYQPFWSGQTTKITTNWPMPMAKMATKVSDFFLDWKEIF